MQLSALIEEIKKGSQLAEKELYAALYKQSLMFCRRYVKNPQDAEERVLDGFYKFFATVKTFSYKTEAGVYAWIKKIMINECLMQLRNKSFLSIVSEDAIEDITDQETILDQLSAEEIMKLITQLPVGYRTVFNLHIVDGYDHKAIAEMLGIAEGSSKSQLFKAKNLLQRMILSNAEYGKQQST